MAKTYREANRGVITNSKLQDFAFCPKLFELKWLKELLPEEESDALTIGSAFDTYMRDEFGFHNEYAVVARRTGNTGKIELTQGQMETVKRCSIEFRRQPLYNPVGKMQYVVTVEFEGLTLKGTLDEFQQENALIIDDKTTASIGHFMGYVTKYKKQLAFYQWLIELAEGIVCDGVLRATTKEEPARFEAFHAPAQSLMQYREEIVELVRALAEAVRSNTFKTSPRSKCMECPAYGVCEAAIQTELTVI